MQMEAAAHMKIVNERLPELEFVAESPFLSAQITLVYAELACVRGDLSKVLPSVLLVSSQLICDSNSLQALSLYTKALEKAKAIPSQRLIGMTDIH
jgi:hypothetical protein